MLARCALILVCLAGSPAQAQEERTVTGGGVVRRAGRETRFHLLIYGHATSLSVESGPCTGRTCTMEWHWLFEGPLTSGPEPLSAGFMQMQSRPAHTTQLYPMERRSIGLMCRRRSPTRFRCELSGALPDDWGAVPRRFDLVVRGM